MTFVQKLSVSLLCAILIFTGFMFFAFSGLFTFIETRFYQPAIVNDAQIHLSQISETLDDYLMTLYEEFEEIFVQNQFVKESFNETQMRETIEGRENAAGILMAGVSGLDAIRIIEDDGKGIHYSTFASDIVTQNDTKLLYDLYPNLDELPYDFVQSFEDSEPQILFDPENERILYSFPFYDDMEIFRGTILFYVASSGFTRELINKNIVRFNDPAVLLGTAENPVFIFGIPSVGADILADVINESFSTGVSDIERILTMSNSESWVLLTNTTDNGISIARIHSEEAFIFPDMAKILLLICLFITSYLIIFLVVNFRQDDLFIIRDRIKRFQIGLIHEYLKNKEDVDWNALCEDISRRKHEVGFGIKKSLGNVAKRHEKEVEIIFDKSWSEIMSAIGQQSSITLSEAASHKIKQILEELLFDAKIQVKMQGLPVQMNRVGSKEDLPMAVLHKEKTTWIQNSLAHNEILEDMDENKRLKNVANAKSYNENKTAVSNNTKRIEKKDEPIKDILIRKTFVERFAEKKAKQEALVNLKKNKILTIEVEDDTILKPLVSSQLEENEVDSIDLSSSDSIVTAFSENNTKLKTDSNSLLVETVLDDFTPQSNTNPTGTELKTEKTGSIMEKAGLFVIPDDLKLENKNFDPDFETLVDSVVGNKGIGKEL